MGLHAWRKGGRSIKRLGLWKPLAARTQVCTDKTGTLTLNQMTARELLLAGRRFTIRATDTPPTTIRTTDGSRLPPTLDHALLRWHLCTDAVLRDGEVVVTRLRGPWCAGEKGGIDVAALRRARPRLLEIPFDSDYKFMATFHDWIDDAGRKTSSVSSKGAPDVLAARADRCLGGEKILPFDAAARQRYDQANDELAEQGCGLMAVGAEEFPRP
jgi:Ca2+-transporting ATPase